MTKSTKYKPLNLRVGELVEVRSLDEILATLDDKQTLDGLLFMPEMVQYCGKRFRVFKSAHKTCDTVNEYVIRRMDDTVHLEGLRCSGEAHDGCQAACLLFWKEQWLRRISKNEEATTPAVPLADHTDGRREGLGRLCRATRVPCDDGSSEIRYRCQATDLLHATTAVRRRDRWNPGFYLKDLSSGNVGIWEFVKFGVLAIFNNFTLWYKDRRYPHLCGLAGGKTPKIDLHLQVGDSVQVKAKTEIVHTLNANLRNRGLSFDVEMVPFCQKTFTVLRKVEKIINEKNGRMIHLPNPCVILDGAVCSGKLSTHRMFCPRSIYPYWHEIWLKPDGQAALSSEPAHRKSTHNEPFSLLPATGVDCSPKQDASGDGADR